MLSPQNRLLNALDPQARGALLQHGSCEQMGFGTLLFRPGDSVERVYFPESGLVSIIAGSGQGEQAEAGMVGREGAVGLVEACGSRVMAAECAIQLSGSVWTLRASDCRRAVEACPQFLTAALRDLEFQLVEARQATLCRAHHPTLRRLARWLLELGGRDTFHQYEFNMTQHYLAAMLGVQRTTVNAMARELQDQGLIRYSRGFIRICDEEALGAVACECRTTLRAERQRICGAPFGAGTAATRPHIYR